jgi:hypothetical protein
MELGDEPEVKTAAKLAQTMAYQNKNFLQVGGWLLLAGSVCCLMGRLHGLRRRLLGCVAQPAVPST